MAESAKKKECGITAAVRGPSSVAVRSESRSHRMYDVPVKEVKDKATDVSTYKCHVCARVFQSHSSLHDHMKNTGHEQKVHSCGVCNKKFQNNHSLRDHMKSTGHEQKTYSCGVCNKNFQNNHSLRDHIE